ncbi:MAG: glycosyltransferase family 2 protein [Lachnospiraceae bacterium]|nr:glycosyltransferase family 2 protein [Lachnospiraceae bacterium]
MKIIEHYQPEAISETRQTEQISVIITAYNIEAYIERGVRSVCAQTYQNLEIIVVDDGSTDATGELCDRLAAEDGRIQVIHKENGGPADARNVGIARSKGSLIGFVDGDDWIDPDMYEKMFGALTEYEADMAVCRYRQVYKTHTEDCSVDRAVLFEGLEALQYYVEEREEYAIQNAAWNKLYRREILADVSFPVGKWYEDIMFATVALSHARRCIYLDTACYNYIIDREGSIMNTQINPRTFTDQIPAYVEKTKFLRELGRQDLADVHDYFFYKRLLLFYDQLREQTMIQAASDEERRLRETQEAYLDKITHIIYDNRERVLQVSACPAADPRDRRRAALFLKSRERYWRKVQWDSRVVVPFKAAVKSAFRKIYKHKK